MYLIGLLIVFALLGVFALQNGGTQDFNLLGYIWHLPTWAPTAAGIALATVLLVIHMGHAGLRHGFRRFGYERTADQHRGLIADLRSENAALREELAAARGEGSASRREKAGSLRSRLIGG